VLSDGMLFVPQRLEVTKRSPIGGIRGVCGRIFLAHRNPTFAEHLELAVRAATLVLIFALPFIFPLDWWPLTKQLIAWGFYGPGALVMFIYTLYKSVGETLSLAWGGIFGTFLAGLNIWFMFGFFPGGVSGSTPAYVWWAGMINGVGFTWVVLWLNLNKLTQVFALSNFVGHWMAFMGPGLDSAYTQGFQISSAGTESAGLLVALAGCGLAVLTTFIPYPLWAFQKACYSAEELVDMLGATWGDIARYYCDQECNEFEQDRLVHDIKALRDSVENLSGHIANSWWECFGLGKCQRSRLILMRLNKILHRNYDHLFCMLYSCTQETFDQQHVNMMQPMKNHIKAVLSEAWELMKINMQCACDGSFDDTQGRKLRDAAQRTREANAALSAEFRATKAALGVSNLSEELLDEHAFCFSVCAFGRLTADFAEELLGHKRAEDLLGGELAFELAEDTSGVSIVFDHATLFDGQHLNFALRNTVAICLGFCVGFVGFGRVLQPLDAGIASTTAVLISKYIGSAMKQNLGRLQGVVLGTIIGQLVYAIFGWCEWWGYLAIGTALWSWVSVTLFTYYDSTKYSGVACLIAAFGAQNFVLGCGDAMFKPNDTYYKIIDAVVAIIIVTFVDLILAPGRASEITHKSFMSSWKVLRDSTSKLMDPMVEEITFHRNEIVSSVSVAEQLGKEAKAEPRGWRTPWRQKAYKSAIKCAYRLQVSISAMEVSVARGGHDGARKIEVLMAMHHMDSFKQVCNTLLDKMSTMETLLNIFIHDLPEPMEDLQDRKFRRDTREGEQKLIRAFLEKANEKGWFQENAALSLEDCPACQVSVLLSAFDSMMEEMNWLQHCILQDS